MTSPSMPWTSVTWVMRRVPSRSRVMWTMRSRADAICSRMARIGRSNPDIRVSVSRRARLSRGLLEWIVVRDPSWPVFMACNMSRASPPRHSPTTIRSGRIRRVLRTRSRMVISPRPSMLGGRASRASTWSWLSWSSLASSTVTIRSSAGMNDDSTLSIVVLPVPVPPEMSTLRRPTTQAWRNLATCGDMLPKPMRSSTVYGSAENFRMVRKGPPMARGWMTALTREPSRRRASTIGVDSSMRRPTSPTILSMMRRRWFSSTNVTLLSSRRPRFSTYTRSGPLTMTSVISGSLRNRSMGPYPRMSSETSWMRWALSAAERGARSFASAAWSCSCTRRRSSSSVRRLS